jgi:general L-amino acid transport system substrate-binding protein
MHRLLLWAALAGALFVPRSPHAQTLDAVRHAHNLSCATIDAEDDWNSQDVHGNLSAFETEICRAVAVAILGDVDAAKPTSFPAEPEALAALKSGSAQLAIGVSPSAAVGMRYGVGFGHTFFYDSQRVMVTRQSRITDLAGLRDRVICALDMSPPEQTLRDEMTARGIVYSLQAHSEQGEMDAAVAVQRCTAATAMETRLVQSRANFHARVTDFVFLPEHFALSPMVPAYRYGDQAFGLIVDWVISALIQAEVLGITQQNVAEAMKRSDAESGQLLGRDFATGQALGMSRDWAARVIAVTGNYGEIFERTTGRPYHLERGLNAVWTKGGLLAPLPMN